MIQVWASLQIIGSFFKALPDLIKLLTAIQTAAQKAAVARKTTDDLQALTKAINEKDPTAIQHIFNS